MVFVSVDVAAAVVHGLRVVQSLAEPLLRDADPSKGHAAAGEFVRKGNAEDREFLSDLSRCFYSTRDRQCASKSGQLNSLFHEATEIAAWNE